MLTLKGINKSYTTGGFTQHALKDLSINFRHNEFVAILGASGSGKTTLLNIIGGLDHYDSGNLIINNKSTKKFKDQEWDSYRNNCVGFIFQSYNLISHISVLSNIEMSMTLSGVKASERKKRALEALDKVGLKNHAHKKPNQLSGGQMQRVAIARALVNDPDIILADEPTGALDSKTSVQIMELIKEIAKDKLVIMVTHNPDLAKDYATRIVELKDGEIINDSNPVDTKNEDKGKLKIKKTAMSFLTALNLSFNNIRTKKGRTFLTAFASSIGIIGIALILSLSNGFDIQIDKFEADTLSSFPITISKQSVQLDEEAINKIKNEANKEEFPDVPYAYPYDSQANTVMHDNKLTEEYVDYIEGINPTHINGISYLRVTGLNLLNKTKDGIKPITSSMINFTALPKDLDTSKESFVEKGFDLLGGSYPSSKTDLVLVVDSKNRIEKSILETLGIDASSDKISFDDIIGAELKLVHNDDFYQNLGNVYIPNRDFAKVYENKNNIDLKIVGVVRAKEDNMLGLMTTAMGQMTSMETNVIPAIGNILYSNELIEEVISESQDSAIVKKQKEVDYNILSGEELDSETKETILTYLGANDVPMLINIYPVDFNAKDAIIKYLDDYNKDLEEEDQIIYTDMADTVSSLSGSIMDGITIVLISFSAISLIVSSIMIGIITYISVLERTKEIGVLRALGARKKDVTRVFNAETFIIGSLSGAIGILIARLLIIPANMILFNLTGLENVAQLNPFHALILITVSVILTLIGGYIPAIIASRKNPVVALRTE